MRGNEKDGVSARSEGSGCHRGLNGHQFVRVSAGRRVGCHSSHTHMIERERRGSMVVVDFAINVFFRRTGVGLSDHLCRDDVAGRPLLLIIYVGPDVSRDDTEM